MNPFRWMAEKLGLVQSAEDAIVVGAIAKVRVISAVTRAHTRHQVEAYLSDLETTGQASLAAVIRDELVADGVLPAPMPLAPTPAAIPMAVEVQPIAADPTPALPPAPEKRKPGRPRKALPSGAADTFQPTNNSH